MRTPVFLITAATLLPIAVWAQVPAPPAKPAAPVVPAKPLARSVSPAPAVPAKPGLSGFFGMRNKKTEPRVDLNLENATVREALKQVFEQAHQEYQVEEDVPDEPRITLRAKNVRLSTALELVLPDENVRTTMSFKDGKNSLRVFKFGGVNAPAGKPGLNVLTDVLNFKLNPDGTVKLPDELPERVKQLLKAHPSLDLNATVPYVLNLQEQRSTFRCPSCKGQSTVIRKADQPKCEKCSRTFMPDWQFCPADGAKRPAAAAEWRFCPFCGKRVEADKTSKIPLLGDLPLLGRLFQHTTPGAFIPVEPAVPQPPTLSSDLPLLRSPAPPQ